MPHVQQWTKKKLKLKLVFFLSRIKSCLLFSAKKRLVSATFMSMLDYGDVLSMHASSPYIHWILSAMEHSGSTQTFELLITIELCMLRSDGLLCLHTDLDIYKAVLGVLTSYLQNYILQKTFFTPRLHSSYCK